MSALLFIVFIIAAAAIDGNPLAGGVCIMALVMLRLLNKRKGGPLWGIKHARIAAHTWIRERPATVRKRLRSRIRARVTVVNKAKRRRNKMNEFKINVEIKGLKELTDAVRALAGMGEGQSIAVQTAGVPQGTYPAPAPVQAPITQAPVAQSYVQAPVQSSPVPAGAGVQQPAGSTVPVAVPTTAMAQEYTIEQLQVAAAGLSGMGKMPQVLGILQHFGIQAMTELPKERYGEFATALREAGAQI